MPSTTPTRPTRVAARSASAKLAHHVAKTRSHRVRRDERRIRRVPEIAAEVRREIVETAPPELTPAARLAVDIVWNKRNNNATNMMEYMLSACRSLDEGTEDMSETSFFFQHPDKNVANGITGLVEDAIEKIDDDLGEFPAPFSAALESVDEASEWNIGNIDTFCGGIQPCSTKDAMTKVDKIVIDVNLAGSSTVVIPFDPERYGDLYTAALSGSGTGLLTKSAGKQ